MGESRSLNQGDVGVNNRVRRRRLQYLTQLHRETAESVALNSALAFLPIPTPEGGRR